MEYIGKQLKLARNKIHISQEDMAEVLGISTRTLQNYEADKTEMPSSKLSIFAKHCKTTVDWLLTGKESKVSYSLEPGIKEKIEQYNSNEITKLKADFWDMKKEFELLREENRELKIINNKLRASITLVNRKGRNGSVGK